MSDDCDLLPKLEVLHLGANKVKEMSLLQLRRFPSLKSLFLEGNDISKIDGLEGCSNLRHLVLDRYCIIAHVIGLNPSSEIG